ncbi:Fibrinogen C domain-containing protein 1-A [Bulinus truncatus]|nr:Fibrinogen C domain-containing protein 1-A [Bulinus truncatus]
MTIGSQLRPVTLHHLEYVVYCSIYYSRPIAGTKYFTELKDLFHGDTYLQIVKKQHKIKLIYMWPAIFILYTQISTIVTTYLSVPKKRTYFFFFIIRKDINLKVSISCPSLPMSCKDVNSTESRVVVTLSSGIRVMCDTKTDGGGWTIFQRRINGRVSFYRGWEEYRFGFGSYADGEFYLGNENIYQLTSRRKHQLRIDLGFRGVRYFAQYSLFRILSENDNYQLKVSGYSGNATDNLDAHADMQFSTFDKDNDKDPGNCASLYTGAWWYSACHNSNLNGVWGSVKYGEGLNWNKLTTYYASVNFTEMKIREIEL